MAAPKRPHCPRRRAWLMPAAMLGVLGCVDETNPNDGENHCALLSPGHLLRCSRALELCQPDPEDHRWSRQSSAGTEPVFRDTRLPRAGSAVRQVQIHTGG